MERLTAYIGKDDWYHETREHNGSTYKTMIPPRLGGDNEEPIKEWDGKASLRMAMCMARIDTLGHSNGEPYDPRIEDR